MKPLELSTDQREKLLEMCKKLFSEVYGISGDYIFFQKDNGISEDHIHWFEFCMTYLPFKMMCVLDKQTNIVISSRDWVGEMYLSIMDSWSDDVHPVDYLYEQFKKIN